MRKKYDDPFGFQHCRKCEKLKPLNKDNYYKSCVTKSGFMIYCKTCDNEQRTLRFKSKESHNIVRRCKQCNCVFYGELAKVRQGKAIFCTRSCKSKYHASNCESFMSLPHNIGVDNPMSKLNEDDIISIRNDYNNNEPIKNICDRFKVTYTHIINIVKGRSWAHIKLKD